MKKTFYDRDMQKINLEVFYTSPLYQSGLRKKRTEQEDCALV